MNYECEKLEVAFLFLFLNYSYCPYIRLYEVTNKLDDYSSDVFELRSKFCELPTILTSDSVAK
jgi:hypothetical protein